MPDKKGNYPLTHCSYNGLTSIVELLITHPDIDVNIKDKDGDTPLNNATLKAQRDVVKQLIEHPETNVNMKNKNGQTALMLAIKGGLNQTAETILKHPDVDIYAEDNEGRTAFDYISYDAANFRNMLNNYQRGVDKRENVLITTKNIPVDIDKLSPEENIWTDEKITDKFLTLVKTQKLEDAEKMINSTPCIDLTRNDNEILNAVCTTGDFRFVKKVFEYEKNQPEMRADYEEKRKDFLENKIQKLSYEELKENPVALHTEDGFRVLMTKEEFNPNDTVDKTSLFELACSMDEDGDLVQDILGKYDNVETKRAKRYAHKDLKEIISTYETDGKYQLKFEHIKRNIANPEKREKAVQQLREFINSEEYTPDMTDTLGNSALHIVATMPDDSARGLIQKLIDKDIDINSQNVTKQTALVSAIKAMRIAQNDEDKTKLLSNIKFLLDKEIDINISDSNGQTAFHHACSTTSPALLTMILAKEPNIFKKDNLGHKGNFYLSTPQMKEVYSNYVNN
ncbi:ankyrin repeat domain-containing protein [bacterium]|nr:ankyrin repeat domain-containing protein [bacterium]